MKAEKIQQIVKDYNALDNHTEKVINKLSKLDNNKYSTYRGIENIDFSKDDVSVACDDSWGGDHDTHYFSFPISFLSMTDAELEQAVIDEKTMREEKKRIEEENVAKEQKLKQEAYEKKQYERLKKKFDNSN